MASTTSINYELLQRLATKPHPLLNIAVDFEAQVRDNPLSWTAEVYIQARTAHHLLDFVGIPQGRDGRDCYASDLDSRTFVAITEIMQLRNRLDRLAAWHQRETGPGGLVDEFCTECGQKWPCDSRRMADGTHEDLTEADNR